MPHPKSEITRELLTAELIAGHGHMPYVVAALAQQGLAHSKRNIYHLCKMYGLVIGDFRPRLAREVKL